MNSTISKRAVSFILTLTIIMGSFFASAQKVTEPANRPEDWSKPFPAFRIVGNVYYVGTYDLACYLIVTSKGNILINTGLASSAPMIKSSVESLGFKFSDIKILTTTQAHYDHFGAMAAIKKQTGAKVMVDEKDASVAEDGGDSDYEKFGNVGSTYQPVKVDRLLKDKDVIALGDTKLTMLHHPGHTRGSCSFVLDVKDQNMVYKVLIVNMPSIIVERKFSDVTAYPDIAKDYEYTFKSLKSQVFDIWLSTHASRFNLHSKHKPGDAYDPNAFIDRKGYDAVVADLESKYLKKIQEQ